MQCPRCQHENRPGSKFCLECGASLGLVCTSCGTGLPAGSRFCDKCGTAVKGEPTSQARFTSPETYTPKHLAEKILTSRSALEGERKQSTVNQVMGDGIMALFGAPVAHEDHAVRACFAALDMQGAIRRYADEVWRTDGITVKIRVGLNS